MTKSIAIVTGASSGIGKSMAKLLAKRGINLIIMARRIERLEELKTELESTFAIKCFPIRVDLSQIEDAQKAFAQAVDIAQKNQMQLDLLINNAGIGEWRPFIKIPLEKQMQNIDVNMKVTTLFVRLFLDQTLGKNFKARILNVASMATFLPVPNYAVYSGTKAYLRYLNEALNYELAGTNIGLTCLCPGGTETEFMDKAGNELTALSKLGMMSPDQVAEIGLSALFKGKQVVVPGISNKITIVIMRLLPQKMGQALMNLVLSLGFKKEIA